MLKSMTGYGRGCAKQDNLQIEVECRAVNHRYCNINLKLPQQLTALESEVRRYVGQRIGRGRIDIFVTLRRNGSGKALRLDIFLAEQYRQALQQLKEQLQLEGELSLELLARNPNLFEIKDSEQAEPIKPLLLQALRECLQDLEAMRIQEGEAIGRDILQRCRSLQAGIKELKPQLARLPQAIQERLRARLEQNAPQVAVSDERLLQEVVIYAARCDTTEEVVRLESHLAQFCNWLQGEDSPIGKKLDFLLQEMNRELTTLSSKVGDSRIIQAVVGLKSELEKVREQVQNIE